MECVMWGHWSRILSVERRSSVGWFFSGFLLLPQIPLTINVASVHDTHLSAAPRDHLPFWGEKTQLYNCLLIKAILFSEVFICSNFSFIFYKFNVNHGLKLLLTILWLCVFPFKNFILCPFHFFWFFFASQKKNLAEASLAV